MRWHDAVLNPPDNHCLHRDHELIVECLIKLESGTIESGAFDLVNGDWYAMDHNSELTLLSGTDTFNTVEYWVEINELDKCLREV